MTVTAVRIARALGRPAPTPEQTAVIEAPAEPMLVTAGAGSGKTETIASRVVYLVANGHADPADVLGLTFTRKAATELGKRIRTRLDGLARARLLGPAAEDGGDPATAGRPLVSTYHAFAGRIITEFGPLVGIDPPSRVLTATASWQLARSIVGRWDGDLATDDSPETVTEHLLALSGALAQHLSNCDDLDRVLDEFHARLTQAPPSPRQRGPVHSKLTGIVRSLATRSSILPLVRAYERAKRDADVVDFADQMQLAARVATESQRAGEMLRRRHRWVLLDEYQDTGHAQRVILRSFFGGDGDARGHPVMAVGDPVQSIYGWRGASAANLPRFTRDFPRGDGSAAASLPLLVSFRNARRVLAAANATSEPVRGTPVPVGELEPRAGADEGSVEAAVLSTVDAEDQWIAERCAAIRSAPGQFGLDEDHTPTMAVLVRRRAAMAGIARALRACGMPVEIVGVGGLIHEPEVADVIAMLRLVVDHQAGPAAVRILTGSRWRLGIADVAALARRARELSAFPARGASAVGRGPVGAGVGPDGPGPTVIRSAMTEALGGEEVDEATLVDAIDDPGDSAGYSAKGYRRITMLGRELAQLRARQPAPLTDLIGDIERSTGLATEVLLTKSGRAHLDAFASVVAEVARTGGGPVELLDYLATAGDREDGLEGVEIEPAPNRVQVLTVHAAKGLEWDAVAIPQLCAGVFPSDRSVRTWWTAPGELPPELRGDREELPELALADDADQGAIAKLIAADRDEWRDRGAGEERRVFYVAATRARHHLLLSAHYWAPDHTNPRQPGQLLTDLVGEGRPIAKWARWSPAPTASSSNPLRDRPVTRQWPVDPLGDRRNAIAEGAAAVQRALDTGEGAAGGGPLADPAVSQTGAEDPEGWAEDSAALLAERAARQRGRAVREVSVPESLSVTALVDMAADPEAFARRLDRPVPRPPAPAARRGTAFHAWLEHRFSHEALIGLTELPGAHDRNAVADDELSDLIAAFESSEWAERTPIAVEVPFMTRVRGQTIRGRMDAVFADDDGGVTIVDWKTGRLPPRAEQRAAAIQLVAYRLAWSQLRSIPLGRVRAVFHEVRSGRTVAPELEAADLERLLADVARPGA